ncbi:MAG: hypothetical protein EBV83_01490 [Verrucomicrobia bacterium]|nr:hypothetical protein [Verrucomicrobiota bacterium]
MLVQADALIESPDRIHRPGHLRFSDQHITEVGSNLKPSPGEDMLKLSGMVLSPGFINLHAHLDLAGLQNRLLPGKDFSDWLRQVISCLPELTPEKRRQSVVESSSHALQTGTTSILSILSDSSTLAGLTSTATRIWWGLEFMDFAETVNAAEVLDRAKAWLIRHPASFWHLALSPHSPYTASPELYRSLRDLSTQQHLPFTTHLAESPVETQFLAGQPSPLRSLLPKELSRKDLAETNPSAMSWCRTNQTLPSSPILAHGNEVTESDLDYLLERKAIIVHCPLAHAWFGRAPFPFPLYRKQGVPVCLGTDSPAGSSNFQFDLRAEVREFRSHHPEVTTAEAWAMITTGPAKALQRPSRLGCLAPGAWADWVAWRIPTTGDLLETILQDRQKAEWTCVGGVPTRHETL